MGAHETGLSQSLGVVDIQQPGGVDTGALTALQTTFTHFNPALMNCTSVVHLDVEDTSDELLTPALLCNKEPTRALERWFFMA